MTLRITKFGVEVLGKPYPAVVVDPTVNTVFPLISEGNWRGEFSVETTWKTAISRSQSTGAEEREGLVSRPTRTISTLISGLDRTETTRMLANAFSMAGTKYPAALYCDYTVATNSSTTSIACTTHWRRFFPGQRIAILPADYSLSSTFVQAQFGVIEYLDADGIVLVDALASACAIGDIILPLVDAQISLSQELDVLTDAVAEWKQECVELSGASTLPGLSEEDVHHLGMSYYKGYPVFDFGPNWRESVRVGVARDGSISQSGNTEIVAPDGARAYLTFGGTFEEYDRRNIWRAARFFDSRKGRLRAFWVVNPIVLFEISSVVATSPAGIIRVKAATSSTHLFEMIEDVAVEYDGGEVLLYEVDSVSDEAGGLIEITLTSALEVDNIYSITSAHLSRFDQDSLLQLWVTDEVCKFDLNYRSLLDEAVYGVTP